MFKVVALLRRRADLSHEEFRARWNEHVPVALDLPNVRRYTRSFPADPEACPYDGIAEMYFDSREACREAFDTEAGARQFEDAARFVAVPGDGDDPAALRDALFSMGFEVRTEHDETTGSDADTAPDGR